MSTRHYGFAIRRNGSCLSSKGEVDCGTTFGTFHACCPSGAFCPSTSQQGYYNAECCDTSNYNCTQNILDSGPFCANTSWTMYNNAGYFCCAPGAKGYDALDNNDGSGCAGTNHVFQSDEVQLSPVSQKAKPTATGSSTSSSSSSSPSSSATPSHVSSSNSTGAIVGGVVGGVLGAALLVGIAWFFLRRARRRKATNPQHSGDALGTELDGHTRSEVEGTPVGAGDTVKKYKSVERSPVELPPDNEVVAELPGSTVTRGAT